MSLFNASPAPDTGDQEAMSLRKIALMLFGAFSGGTPLAVDTGGGSAALTASFHNMAASQTVTIPTTAKEWTWSITSGTATVGGVSGIPVGVSDSSSKPPAVAIAITTAASSTAYVRWST